MSKLISVKYYTLFLTILLHAIILAQAIDNFNGTISKEWNYFSGDGNAKVDFVSENRIGKFNVDASNDIYNTWWAVIKRDISSDLDLSLLQKDNFELRIEAKIKVSHSPRRINLSVNTQRTTDFHSNLMEYEIPDTSGWHIVSLTTDRFDAIDSDTVYVQLAMMDWGIGVFETQIEYLKVDVVNKKLVGRDVGNLVPYHLKIQNITEYDSHIPCFDAAIISSKFKNENYSSWQNYARGQSDNLLTVSGDQIVILKWNYELNDSVLVNDHGLLELNFESYQKGDFSLEELSQIRLVELNVDNVDWNAKTVTFNKFINGYKEDIITNRQPIYDLDLVSQDGTKKFFTVSKFVLQRLLDGKSNSLALFAIGPIIANIRIDENDKPRLHFNQIAK